MTLTLKASFPAHSGKELLDRAVLGEPPPLKSATFAITPVRPFAAGSHPDLNAAVMDMLARLVNCACDQLEGELEAAFCRICKFLELDSGGLWRLSSQEPANFSLVHLYLSPTKMANAAEAAPAEGAVPSFAHSQALRLGSGADSQASFPWISAEVRSGRAVVFSTRSELPPHATEDKENLARLGIQSAIINPVKTDGRLMGAVSFAFNREQAWSEPLMQRLQFITQVLACGMEQIIQRNELRAPVVDAREFKAALDQFAVAAITDPQGEIT